MKYYMVVEKGGGEIFGLLRAPNKAVGYKKLLDIAKTIPSDSLNNTLKFIKDNYDLDEIHLMNKTTDKELDGIIEGIMEETEFEVEVTGYHEYDVVPQWGKKARVILRKELERYRQR